METKHKKGLTLGDLITAAYQVWGARQAGKMVGWALETRRVVRREAPRLLLSPARRRLAV